MMKSRAGDIGRSGLGPLLAELHRRTPQLRVHLVGHSFGARLVSFAARRGRRARRQPGRLAGADPGRVLALVVRRGAGQPVRAAAGALNGFADRVHGPLVATFSSLDWAVGRWYPKASFLAGDAPGRRPRDAGAAWVPTGSRRWSSAAADHAGDGGTAYDLAAGSFYAVDAEAVINDTEGQPFAGAHSDIRDPAIGQLIASAAAAHT